MLKVDAAVEAIAYGPDDEIEETEDEIENVYGPRTNPITITGTNGSITTGVVDFVWVPLNLQVLYFSEDNDHIDFNQIALNDIFWKGSLYDALKGGDQIVLPSDQNAGKLKDEQGNSLAFDLSRQISLGDGDDKLDATQVNPTRNIKVDGGEGWDRLLRQPRDDVAAGDYEIFYAGNREFILRPQDDSTGGDALKNVEAYQVSGDKVKEVQYKWGLNEIGTGGGTVSWEFGQFSEQFSLAEIAELKRLIVKSFKQWTDVADIDVVEKQAGDNSGFPTVVISVIDLAEGEYGEVDEFSYPAEPKENEPKSPIEFNLNTATVRKGVSPAASLAEKAKLEHVILHEAGHAIALNHAIPKESVLFPFDNGDPVNLTSFDRAYAQYVYGAKGGSPSFGNVEDGPLSGATVFHDENGNLQLDPGEVFAITNDIGDYLIDVSDVDLVVIGGTDTTTDLPFNGFLRSLPGSDGKITPLTTVASYLSEAGVANPEEELADKTAIDGVDLAELDLMRTALNGDSEYLEVALQLYIVSILVTEVLEELEGSDPTVLLDVVFGAMASMLRDSQSEVDFTDQATILGILQTLLSDRQLAIEGAAADAISSIIAAINGAIADAQNELDGQSLIDHIAALQRVAYESAIVDVARVADGSLDAEQAVADYTGIQLEQKTADAKDAIGQANGQTIVGTPDPDILNGTSGYDDVTALASDDVVNGSAGSDLIDGGSGHDAVVYDGERADYTQTLNGNGTITVEKPGGGTDTLTTIERIDFTDGDYVYDLTSPNTGFGYRIYQASFGRTPDEGGVRFWIGNLDNFDQQGWSDYEKEQFLASQFIQSDEFRDLYGANPSNFDYIDAMYQNVLFRLPDQAGYDFWVGGMENDGLTREDILIAFTKSDENVNNNSQNLDDGVWVV